MLEAIHLTKIYKTKGSNATKALDDVSISFPETGMVFLLGKSGSGKSTLLNVCGGLDSPTSGEIIINGRSIKNFSQSDFDSYRNTLVGFIFQEYNVLNEFSVENNIALALQLQGKPKDKKAIKKLLEDVDLVGYERRKPNTLSGGQKQRIAIARALVKEPKIIMADEPTGALDSNTGILVFDTLKKLSKDKLVIVVSHDREFAEKYADRIIELKDGQIISDVTKKQSQPQDINDNIQLIGKDTVSIKNSKSLTDEDFEYIRSFLSNNDSAIIASNQQEVTAYKKANRITENGEKEYFEDTDENEIERIDYDPSKQKFIRSKLPIRHAFKIGSSGLKSKPIRLIFTIFMCTIAFIMFGVSSTLMLFNENEVLYQTFDDSGSQIAIICKQTKNNNYPFISDDDVKRFANVFGGNALGVNYNWNLSIGSPNAGLLSSTTSLSSSNEEYYANGTRIKYCSYLPSNESYFTSRIKFGQSPQKDNEIMISSYTASVIIKSGAYNVTKQEELIGQTLYIGANDNLFVISGIFDSGDEALSNKYGKYKNVVNYPSDATQRNEMYNEISRLKIEIDESYHLLAFFSKNTFIKKFSSSATGYDHALVNYTSGNKGALKSTISFNYSSDGVLYYLENSCVAGVANIASMAKSLLKYFIIIGVVLAVFSMLLLSNYIAISISYKKKEIGLLRAIGARSVDVFKIFFSESFIIACISIILSTIGSVVCCNYLNLSMSTIVNASLFVFGLPSFGIMSAIAIFAAFVATLLPVFSAARKKPVEAIRAL